MIYKEHIISFEMEGITIEILIEFNPPIIAENCPIKTKVVFDRKKAFKFHNIVIDELQASILKDTTVFKL